MERAIFTNEPEKHDLSNYNRLYFGNEFCQNNLIGLRKTREIVNLALDKGKKITFVTPFVTDNGLERIKRYFPIIPEGSEIVINDYGLLKFLADSNEDKFELVFGRLLSRQKRGPRIMQMKDKISRSAYRYFQGCNLGSIDEFLLEKRIKRAEVDNTIQGLLVKTKMKLSLYYPWVYVSTTRLCLLNGIDNLARKKIIICPCKHECGKYILTSDSFPLRMYLKGVTQYYHNDKFSSGMLKLIKNGLIDRVVWMPEMIV